MSGIPIAAALRDGAERLRAVADNPRLEARLLLAHALGTDTAALIREPGRIIDPAMFQALVDRRAAGAPLAHLTGRREFWSLDLAVSPVTLIPRPDSETVVEAALAATAGWGRPFSVLDLGTGTGCLLLAVLSERLAAFGIGVDLAPGAAALAAANARSLGLADRCAFLRGDWTTAIAARFDLVLSNPPYIPTADIPGLMAEVSLHEPASALDGGADGLDFYRRLVADLAGLLRPGGVAVLEVGAGQAEAVIRLAGDAGFTAESRPDLAGIPRAVLIQSRRE